MVDSPRARQRLVKAKPARLGHTPWLENLAPDSIPVHLRPLQHQDRSTSLRQHRSESIAGDPAPDDDHLECFSRDRRHHLLHF
jgi:hypothetical protein